LKRNTFQKKEDNVLKNVWQFLNKPVKTQSIAFMIVLTSMLITMIIILSIFAMIK